MVQLRNLCPTMTKELTILKNIRNFVEGHYRLSGYEKHASPQIIVHMPKNSWKLASTSSKRMISRRKNKRNCFYYFSWPVLEIKSDIKPDFLNKFSCVKPRFSKNIVALSADIETMFMLG